MRHRRSVGFAALVAMVGMVAMPGVGPTLGQSADPSATPAAAIELPTTLFVAPAGDAPAIRWSGDGEGQAGRGQVPFRLFASGSRLDEAAAALGLDPAMIVGDRGYARGADPDTVYAIDVVVDPAITATAWTHAFITGVERTRWPSWDQLDTAAGPVIFSGWHGGFRWATEGLAVEVMPIDLASDQLDELIAFFEQLPPNGIPPVTDAVALERGRQLGAWVPPLPLAWNGNILRSSPDPILPRPMSDVVFSGQFTDLPSPVCIDPDAVLGFAAGADRFHPEADHDVMVMEWLDPAGDATRWVVPLRTYIRSQMDGQGHRAYRRLGPARLDGREGAVLRSRSGDHLVVIVTSGPAVTIFSGKASDVDQVMATYPFADPGTATPDASAAGTPTPSCVPADG